VAREPAGRRVLAGEDALGQRRPHDLADALRLAHRHDLGLDHPPDQRVLRLVRHDAVETHVVGQADRLGDLLRVPLRHPDVVHLALAHQVVEGPHRLLERRLVVEAVGLEEVDVVGLEALERGVQ
jgi:hypothetical protein